MQGSGRWRKRLTRAGIGLLALGLVAGSGGWFYALPRAQSALTQALREAGYPAGEVRLALHGWRGLTVTFYDNPSQDPFARATLWPWSLSTLRLTDVAVTAFPTPAKADTNAAPWWTHPIVIPSLPYHTVVMTDVVVGPATLGMTATRAPEGGWVADLTVDVPDQWASGSGQIRVAPDGRYAVTGDVEKSLPEDTSLSVSLALEAGRDVPVISGQVSGFAFSFVLNPDKRPGVQDLPFTGRLSAFPDLRLAGTLDPVAQHATLTAEGDLKSPAVTVTGLKARAEGITLWPPVVPDGQIVTAAQAQAGGFPLEKIQATVGYRDGALRIGSARAEALGGRISLAPFSCAVPPASFDTTVTLENVDLAQALVLAAVEGLGGAGRLSGQIPVQYQAGKVRFGAGTLTAREAGNLAYRPATPPAFLAEGGQGALLAQVFSDFRYSALALRLEGTPGDTLTLGARIEGSNPSFYGGHPVSFNLTLSGDLATVLQQGLKGLRLSPGALHDLVQQGGQP